MKVLIDLRSVDYGQSGGIENYAYYLIESIKQRDIKLILDIPFTSRKQYLKRHKKDKNIKIICDPLQFVVLYSKSKHKIVCLVANFLGKTIFKWFNIEFTRRRKQWANSTQADLVYYPYHLDELQHFNIPVVTTIHAILPNYSQSEIKAIESHVEKAKALITSWNYPYKELIKKYPLRKDDWYLIHYIAVHNLNPDNQIEVEGITKPFYIYISFFMERKNHLNLIRAYNIARKRKRALPNLVLVGEGDPAYKDKVRSLISELGLDKTIIVYGYLPDENISYLYHNCKAVIAPTLWEAASGTALEASYCGKPVLCSNVPPLKDFAEYFNLEMMFFDPNNIEDISKVILEFENYGEKLTRQAKENAKSLRKYDIKYFGDSIMQVFENTIKQKYFQNDSN